MSRGGVRPGAGPKFLSREVRENNARMNLLAKIDTSPGPNKCWPWKGHKNFKGYGMFGFMGAARKAARVLMYFYLGKQIPDGKFVCHSCDNPECMNPAHLFIGSPADNLQDSITKGRFKASEYGKRNKGKRYAKACRHGHEYLPGSYKEINGFRSCNMCRKAKQRKADAVKKARRKQNACH